MGLSSKHVSGDHQAGFEWGPAEVSKPPSSSSIRRHPPPHQQAESLKCPRCNSANTKFCYYNNYNKSQPRHFCKSCKRHWTKGGTLRNVPLGGGRKNKRPKISKPASAGAVAAQRQQDFPLSGNAVTTTTAQKSMPSFVYEALLHETTKGFMGGSNGVNTASTSEFQFSGLNNFDMNLSLNPTSSYQLPLTSFDQYVGNLDSIEESTITTVNNIPSSSSGPWPGPDSGNTLQDLPNYWNWSDIDVLNSADLNISWDDDDDNDDDAEIKPQNKFQD